jgi:ComF family protein
MMKLGHWRQFVKSFLNLFLKSNCPLCSRSAVEDFCPACLRQLTRCKFSHSGQFWQGENPVFVWGEYRGTLKNAIAALKYNNNAHLARPLGYWLADAWLSDPPLSVNSVIVVPIPLHRDKLKQRGFNQADLLAESFCELTGFTLKRQGLERIKNTDPLFNLSPRDRRQQMQDSFILGQDFRGKPPSQGVLLLDDIYTTGATVSAAIKTLNQAQIKVYGTVAIAIARK